MAGTHLEKLGYVVGAGRAATPPYDGCDPAITGLVYPLPQSGKVRNQYRTDAQYLRSPQEAE
jgi:hypothetical protein